MDKRMNDWADNLYRQEVNEGLRSRGDVVTNSPGGEDESGQEKEVTVT
jgi:hypothetical protein